jgi:hypothetical protein
MDLGDIIGAAGSALSGGLLGVLGFGVKAFFGFLADREKRALVAVQHAHELALIREQRATLAVETEHEREIAAEETRRASYDFADVTGQPVWTWVASVVSLMRPLLTLYLTAVASLIVYDQLFGAAPDVFVRNEAVALVMMLTSSCVLWWFGDRPRQAR